MDCQNCEMNDGPIGGLPCSHYWECYSKEFESCMRFIDNNISLCTLVVDRIKKEIVKPIINSEDHLEFLELENGTASSES